MLDLSATADKHPHNFFSSLAILQHSLATPVTNLLLNLELLQQDPNLNKLKPNNDLYLKRALLSAKYLREIIKQCKIYDHRPEHQFNIKESLHELIQICQKPTSTKLLIPFIQLNGQEQLTGNKLYFQEAVICLLNNAFQAYQRQNTNKYVLLFVNKTQQELKLRVVDKGQGFLCLKDSSKKRIKPDQLTTKGTGLSFIEQVVVNHFLGKVFIESEPEKGTCIYCSFPLTK